MMNKRRKVGEFPAFLAITAYAIVPSIRYTEHGLRSVSPDYVEVARSAGRSLVEFKRGMRGIEDEVHSASYSPPVSSYDDDDHGDRDEATAPKFEPPPAEASG